MGGTTGTNSTNCGSLDTPGQVVSVGVPNLWKISVSCSMSEFPGIQGFLKISSAGQNLNLACSGPRLQAESTNALLWSFRQTILERACLLEVCIDPVWNHFLLSSSATLLTQYRLFIKQIQQSAHVSSPSPAKQQPAAQASTAGPYSVLPKSSSGARYHLAKTCAE